jgi:hypothetical protein
MQMAKRDLKIIAGTLIVVGAILSVFDKIFAADHLLLESSPNYPDALRTIGWLFLLIPPLIYIALDFPNLFPLSKSKDKIKSEDKQNGSNSENKVNHT